MKGRAGALKNVRVSLSKLQGKVSQFIARVPQWPIDHVAGDEGKVRAGAQKRRPKQASSTLATEMKKLILDVQKREKEH